MKQRVAIQTFALTLLVILLASGLTGILFRLVGLERAGVGQAMAICAVMCLILAPIILGPLVHMAVRLDSLCERLRQAALTDPLTGLANRRAFFEEAAARLRYAPGGPEAPLYAILMIDADRFKDINDRHGHETGDAALAHLAGRICDSLARAGEEAPLIARLGGEEFIVLLTGVTAAGARLAAEVICEGIRSTTMTFRDQRLSMTVSIGVWVGSGRSLDQALSLADRAVYAAKAAGRDCWRFAEDPACPGCDGTGPDPGGAVRAEWPGRAAAPRTAAP